MRLFPIMDVGGHEFRSLGDGLKACRKEGLLFAVVAVPWDMIGPHDNQAQRNHDQTLERLAQRGGLSACEALAVLGDRGYHDVRFTVPHAHYVLHNLVVAWLENQPAANTPDTVST